MASISDIVKAERAKLGLNQSEFGLLVDLIMTDVSKVENGSTLPSSFLRATESCKPSLKKLR